MLQISAAAGAGYGENDGIVIGTTKNRQFAQGSIVAIAEFCFMLYK